VHPVEDGVFGLGEGPPTTFAAITALLLAMDHEVALSRTSVGAAAPVVTELPVRVHADTHPLFGGQRPNKDAVGPAYSSTQPSSTLPWGATVHTMSQKNKRFFNAESRNCPRIAEGYIERNGENHRDLLTRLSTALAMTEAAYLEARRRRDLQVGPTAGVLEERDDTGILLSITDPQRGSVEHRFFPWSSVITMAASMR
jgi:hypothetical protein